LLEKEVRVKSWGREKGVIEIAVKREILKF
jgi:hypothetical protein